MEPNKFDYNIKEKMEARTIAPSAEAWEKLEAMMPLVDQPKRKVAWLYIAASFIGLLLVGTIFFQNFETNIVKKDIPLVLEQNESNDRPQELEMVKEAAEISKKDSNTNRSVIRVVAAKEFQSKKATNEKKRTSEPSTTNLINEDQNVSSSLSDISKTTASGSLYISAAELLATVSNAKLQTTASDKVINVPQQGIKVNANSLLSNVESELNQSFRETALTKLSKNFNSIKTVLVNRNYEE